MESKIRKLTEIGIDTKGVLERLGGNSAVYLHICNKFVHDDNFLLFEDALSRKDYNVAELRIHTLKGIAANLGFKRLELYSSNLLEAIRCKEYTFLDQDNRNLSEEYYKVIHTLKELN